MALTNLTARREALLTQLGGCCAICGATERLEIDHPHGRSYQPRDLSRQQRQARYEREARRGDGTVRVLCRSCNAGYKPVPRAKLTVVK